RKLAKYDKFQQEGNLLMQWGEPLAIYNPTETELTRQQITSYMKSKGYFNALVDFEVKESKSEVEVTYNVHEGPPYILNKVYYTSEDQKVLDIAQKDSTSSLLKVGENYNQALLSKERERLEHLLQNKGYYGFSRKYIDFTVYYDSISVDSNPITVETRISSPIDKKEHSVFQIDSVEFITDIGVKSEGRERKTKFYNGINFKYYDRQYSEKILAQRVYNKAGELYSREKNLQTQLQLGNLDMFGVNVFQDTTGGQMITKIYATPYPKFQWTNELGFNVKEDVKTPGPFYNMTFKDRNLFKGMEVLALNFYGGINNVILNIDDTDPDPDKSKSKRNFAEVEIGTNLSLSFPQFIFPFGNRFQRLLGNTNPRTSLSVGYDYLKRSDRERTNFNTALVYSWQKPNKFYSLRLADINLILSDWTDEFRETLESFSPSLKSSFNPSFVSSAIFTATYNFKDSKSGRDKSYLKIQAENGGSILNLTGTGLLERAGLEHYQFFRFNTDYRATLPTSQKSELAYKINFGIAQPYGGGSKTDEGLKALPYDKYFFAGGSYGIRAWSPRRLGPGSYKAPDLYNYEQFGELLLESSIEFRHPLFGFLEGAFFVDAGNIWMISEDNREGSQFKFDKFYKQIAVGAGYGIRVDLSFLMLRFDIATKLIDPSGRFSWKDINIKKPFGIKVGQENQTLINFGIGYPF
ncbi:BamA/TamA family outer membrane protein, partial [Xanthovirga aplysinae]|uniref:translocation and assembly module lipoprotein TamL n=1 Tax=Xanthovirga aplysinae TaxID=2529853 RepID=UPI0012BD7714